MELERMLALAKPDAPLIMAVAVARPDSGLLRAICTAYAQGLIIPILCGDRSAISETARAHDLDVTPFMLVPTLGAVQAAKTAAGLVAQGRADLLMNGGVQTADFLSALSDARLVPSDGLLSHISVVYSAVLQRPLLITDGAVVDYPDLKTKADMVENAVRVAGALGLSCPRVAVVAPSDLVDPGLPATLDAALLTVMNQRGQISGCLVDGPLPLDAALRRPADCGADILLFHNIDIASAVIQSFAALGGIMVGGIAVGTASPVVFPLSDRTPDILYSIACAVAVDIL